MLENFSNNVPVYKNGKTHTKTPDPKPIKFPKVSNLSPPLVPPRLTKEKLNKLKFHGEHSNKAQNQPGSNSKQKYPQVLSANISNILKLSKSSRQEVKKHLQNYKQYRKDKTLY